MGKKEKGHDTTRFFLYEKLNENDTKNLRKAKTRTDERKILTEIFELEVPAGDQSAKSKMNLLLLDFHCINYDFAHKSRFSNEKVSTFLAIMDFLFHHMLERQIQSEDGSRLLKSILKRHCL
jgi:hypothetical protein